MRESDKKNLMVFIEPTPYILDLLEKGFDNLHETCDVVFLTQNLTQQWDLKLRVEKYLVVTSKKKILQIYVDTFIKRKYRLLHVAGWSNPFIIFLILMSRLLFIPVVVETDTSLNSSLAVWKKIIKKLVYPILLKFPVFFLPGGTRQTRYLVHYGVNPKKIMNAQMTVDVKYINEYVKKINVTKREKLREKNGAHVDDVIFLFVGRLLDWKGVRELIAAFKITNNDRAKLWIVGDGELNTEVELASKQNKKIRYFGRVSGDYLWNIYHAADVFVVPSYHEPWGLVINEAMAVGLPVIATNNVGCIDDLVENNQQGLIVQSQNVDELLKAMNDMLQNSEKKRLMARNAMDRILGWTLQNEAKNIMSAWKKVCH